MFRHASFHISISVVLLGFYFLSGCADTSEPPCTSTSEIYVNDNSDLNSIAECETISADIFIAVFPSLENLDVLSGLKAVEGNLTIANNESLQNLDGLANLVSVRGSLAVTNNAALTQIDGGAQANRPRSGGR